MYNDEMVSSLLLEKGISPAPEPEKPQGLRLSLDGSCLLLEGTAADLIELADLLISLALSGEANGQHWHLDSLTLLDEASEIPELILSRK